MVEGSLSVRLVCKRMNTRFFQLSHKSHTYWPWLNKPQFHIWYQQHLTHQRFNWRSGLLQSQAAYLLTPISEIELSGSTQEGNQLSRFIKSNFEFFTLPKQELESHLTCLSSPITYHNSQIRTASIGKLERLSKAASEHAAQQKPLTNWPVSKRQVQLDCYVSLGKDQEPFKLEPGGRSTSKDKCHRLQVHEPLSQVPKPLQAW